MMHSKYRVFIGSILGAVIIAVSYISIVQPVPTDITHLGFNYLPAPDGERIPTRLSQKNQTIVNPVPLQAVKTVVQNVMPTQKTNFSCKAKTVKASPRTLPITGLLSFPGSGNTWSRHLIQQMSGLGTSSCYCDGSLRMKGFPLECHSDKSKTLVVKSHEYSHVDKYRFKKIVLLIRNPYDALLAYANFAKGGHTGRPSKPILIQASKKMFEHSMRWYINLTNRTIAYFKGPVHILQYEQLKTNMADTLTKLADFLNVNITQTDIDCTVKLQEGNFHRKVSEQEHLNLLKEVYDKNQLQRMRELADVTETMLKDAYGVDLDVGWVQLEQLLFDS